MLESDSRAVALKWRVSFRIRDIQHQTQIYKHKLMALCPKVG